VVVVGSGAGAAASSTALCTVGCAEGTGAIDCVTLGVGALATGLGSLGDLSIVDAAVSGAGVLCTASGADGWETGVAAGVGVTLATDGDTGISGVRWMAGCAGASGVTAGDATTCEGASADRCTTAGVETGGVDVGEGADAATGAAGVAVSLGAVGVAALSVSV